MPIYQYEGQHYDLDTTDPAAATARIEAHLGIKKGTHDLPADPNVTSLADRGKAALGGLELAGSMLSKAPGMIAGGLSGLGTLMLGGGIDKATEQSRGVMEGRLPGAAALKGYDVKSDQGKLAAEALQAGKDVSTPVDIPGWPKLSAGLTSASEAAFDIDTMLVPLGPKGRMPIDKARIEAQAGALRSIEAAKKAESTKPLVEPGTQPDLALEHFKQSPSPDILSMMEQAKERFAQDEPYRQSQASIVEPQPDMFRQEQPASFPGEQRLADERAKAGEQSPLGLPQMPMEPTPRPDVPGMMERATERDKQDQPFRDWQVANGFEAQGDLLRPTIGEWPAKERTTQLRIDTEPYVKTVRGEIEKTKKEWDRLERWMIQFKKRPSTMVSKVEALKKQEGQLRREESKYTKELRHKLENPEILAKERYEQRRQDVNPDTELSRLEGEGGLSARPLGRNRQRGAVDIEAIHGLLKDLEKRAEALAESLPRLLPHVREKAETRLEKLYMEQMKLHNALIAINDKNHPHHEFYSKKYDNPMKGPGKGQAGIIKPNNGIKIDESDPLVKAMREDMAKNPERAPIPTTGKEFIEPQIPSQRTPTDRRLSPRGPNAGRRSTDTMDPFKGPGKKQTGAINLQGFDFGGIRDLPEHLKEWILTLAEERAARKLRETGGMDRHDKPIGKEAQNEFLNYIRDDLANEHFVKQAIAASATGFDKMQDVHTMGVKGHIGRQEGAIKFRDPEFERFRANLPLPMRKDAKALFKEYKKQLEGKESQIYENESTTSTLDGIPGLRDWKNEIAPIPIDTAAIKEKILKEEDLGSGRGAHIGRQILPGGKLLGFGTQNTLVRFTTQQMDNALRAAQRSIEDLILDKNTGFKGKWEALNKEDFGQLWANLIAHEGKMDLGRDKLFELGLGEKQVEAALSIRAALDKVFDRLDGVRQTLGKPPLDRRLGYIPSRFRGDWIVEVRDAEGALVHRMGAATKDGAKNLVAWMEEKHPELTVGGIEHEPLHRFKDASDANAGYQALLEVLAKDDPRVAALESTYADFMQRQAYEVMGVRHHFKRKAGEVQGAEGFKEWKTAEENAREGLRSVMNYIDHAMKWAEVQEAIKPVKELLKDEEIINKQKEATQWSQSYIDQALGRSPKLARAIDTIFDHLSENTGLGQSLMLKGVREIKDWMTSYYLGFWNVGFSISQLVQVVQTIPGWQLMLKNKGADASIFKSYAQGAIEAIKFFGPNRLSEHMSPLAKEAMAHSHNYAVTKPHLLDEVRTATGRDIKKWEEWIRTKNMTIFEEQARTMAYLTWVHFLNNTGRFKPGRELYETAANLTDMTMVDYRTHERAMMYKQLGTLPGEMSNALTTYKHNFYGQIWALNRHRNGVAGGPAGGLSPVGAILTTGLALGGLLGLPGREDVDAVIRLYNMGAPYVGAPRMPSTRELAMKAPDLVAFGGASAVTGLDLSGKFSMANVMPDNPLAFLQPFGSSLYDMGGAAAGLAANPSKTQAMRSLHTLTPGPIKAGVEEYFKDGSMYIDPKTMAGKVKRDGVDHAARYLSLRGLHEAREGHKVRDIKDQDQFLEHRRSILLDRAVDALYENKTMHLGKLAQDYVDNEGTPTAFLSHLKQSRASQKVDAVTAMLMHAMSNPRRAKRIVDQR